MRKSVAFLAALFIATCLACGTSASAQVCEVVDETGRNLRAARLNNSSALAALCTEVTTGSGSESNAAATVDTYGDRAMKRSIWTIDDLVVTMTDAGAAGSHGSAKIYDFPEGMIFRAGCVAELSTTAGAGGISDTAALVGALGTTATATDNATLTTTEANFVPSIAGTLTGGAGSLDGAGDGSVTLLDGHTSAVDLYLNIAVPDADSTASDTVTVSGTVSCVWTNVGDY